MSPSRKPLPSFMLVLTSGHHSLLPTTLQFDSSAMLLTAPDSLVVHNPYGLLYVWLTLHQFASENHRFA
ncbi:hypothetical protein BYT27DRAFT_7181513 [Phlegmacium glaucopus]|nr:hypothetical protein BYT27DRAFT_7181513 [Phlegmacium glaucopus]